MGEKEVPKEVSNSIEGESAKRASQGYYLGEVHNKGAAHADSVDESREFYAEFWKELSGDVNDYGDKQEPYGGETIISFNTVAGCFIRTLSIYREMIAAKKAGKSIKPLLKLNSAERMSIINTKDDAKAFKDKFQRFYNLYHSRANFMPLVKGSVSLNMLKGGASGPYYDFPDLFFSDIRELYSMNIKECKAKGFFFDERNVEYFNKFGSWNVFVEKNYLQDFFEDNENSNYSNFKILAPNNYTEKDKEGNEVKVKMPYNQKIELSDEEKKVFQNYITKFLDTAIGIIEARASRLAEEYSRRKMKPNY